MVKKIISPVGSEIGKLPPQAIEAEQYVIGTLITLKNRVKYVIDILPVEAFYKEIHAIVYASILELYRENKPIDLISLTFHIKSKSELGRIGGVYELSKLTNNVSNDIEHLKYHAKIIRDCYLRRELIKVSDTAKRDAYEDVKPTSELLKEVKNSLNDITEYEEKDFSIKASLKEVIEYIAAVNEKGSAGLPTGYKKFDSWTGGFAFGEVVVIAGNPGSFKTGIALDICHHNAGIGNPVFIFSQEMSGAQIGMREISMHSLVPYDKIRKGDLNKLEIDMIHKAINKIENFPVYRDTSSGLTRSRLMKTVEKMTTEYGVKLFVIDYFQLMNHEVSRGELDARAMEKTTALMKVLAKQFNCVIIALSQLTKESRVRPGDAPKRHYPSELRGTGSLEQDCDMLFFTWNPSSIKPGFVYSDGVKEVFTDGMIALDVHKFRGGQGNALCWLRADAKINRFYDEDDVRRGFTDIQPDF